MGLRVEEVVLEEDQGVEIQGSSDVSRGESVGL